MKRVAKIRPRAVEIVLVVLAGMVSRAVSTVKVPQHQADIRKLSRGLVATDGSTKPLSLKLDIGERATPHANSLSGYTIVNLAQNRP